MSEPLPSAEPMRPVAGVERVEVIDVVRGFALFGVLLVNMAVFKSSMWAAGGGGFEFTRPVDDFVRGAVVFLAQGKFYTIFSLLFGLGLAIQIERAATRGARIAPLYARRVGILLVIGLLHAFFIWWGDILNTYALLGFALLLFRNCRPKTLVIWAVVLLLLAGVLLGGLFSLQILGAKLPQTAELFAAEMEKARTNMVENAADSVVVYSSGTWSEIMVRRAKDLGNLQMYFFLFMPTILGIFLLGLAIGRSGAHRDIERYVPFLKRAMPWLLVIGLVGSAAVVVGYHAMATMEPSFKGLLYVAGNTFGTPALAFFYLAAVVLLFRREGPGRRLAVLAPVGRMALTNYLLQSIVCTLIFYSYGLGLFGRVPPLAGVGIVLILFSLQIVFSAWWLQRFRFGPVEWLWRTLTYGKAQPMRRDPEAA